MVSGSKIENHQTDHGESRNETTLEDTCALFADKFNFFEKNCLWECELKENAEDEESLEIGLLLEKMEWLQILFSEATLKNTEFKRTNLPFISVVSKSGDASKDTLAIEIIPCEQGNSGEISHALERMKQMVYLIALLKKSRGKFKTIYETLKFLYSHLQRQLFPDRAETEPLSYDADMALQLLEVMKMRPSEALINKHLERVRQKFGTESTELRSKLGWHSAISRDVMSVQNLLRNKLKERATDKDHPSAVQAVIKTEIEKKIL